MRTLGWYRDPAKRHELRFFDGARWTRHVADRGVRVVEGPDDDVVGGRAESSFEASTPDSEHTNRAQPSVATTRRRPPPAVLTPGWYADPYGRHELRYFDGREYTEYVADDDLYRIDPP